MNCVELAVRHARDRADTIALWLPQGGGTTTTFGELFERAARIQASLRARGLGPGDTVLLRYANATDPSSSSRSETIRVHAIGEDGIVGANASGELVVAKYDELLQVEKKTSGFSGVPGAETGGNILMGITNSALLVACAMAAAYSCPTVGD